jgi:hypothetical protein
MVKKVLVERFKPVIKALKNDGLEITRAELYAAELNKYYTLAISADWKDISPIGKHTLIRSKMRELLPLDVSRYILNIYTYKTPEDIDRDLETLTRWELPVGESVM